MNYKIILLLFLTTFILTPVFALDCQYTQSVFDHAETIAVPYSVDSDDPIEEITYTIAGTEKAPIYFFNENDFNVDIEFDLLYYIPGGYTGNYGPHTSHITRTIIPGTSEMAFGYSKGYYSKISNLIYRQNEFVYLKNKEKSIYVEICKVCGDVNCLDDGFACSINSECGSNNCIRGLCSTGATCYNNDCNCASDQIQYNNQRCINKGSVAIGGTPQTSNPEECITNYISPNTGKCVTPLGSKCFQNFDCGENYCITGTCSNNQITCYNNNCGCKETEIQFENRTCMPKASVINGNKPTTGNYEECISKYVDPNTGLCAMTPEQKELQEQSKLKSFRNFILAIMACFVIFMIVFVGYKIYKNEQLKKADISFKTFVGKTAEADKINDTFIQKINQLKKDIETAEAEEKELSNKLIKINKKLKNETHDKEHLNALLKQKEAILLDINKNRIVISEDTKKLNKEMKDHKELVNKHAAEIGKEYYNTDINKWVVKIPKIKGYDGEGYECFYKEGKSINEYEKGDLVHLSVWKQAHGRYPKFGYDIHHKDFNKYNNRADNLVEISKQEHRRLHNERYKSI